MIAFQVSEMLSTLVCDFVIRVEPFKAFTSQASNNLALEILSYVEGDTVASDVNFGVTKIRMEPDFRDSKEERPLIVNPIGDLGELGKQASGID
ncbi:unnamed protein product [Dibothriocephalus latus]|uniref:Uncharacterized protein n=1 Tax=Dibothriocephalus latus TaxID=60516 RepID=A0A3P7RXX7_DIBLA|nr:unnamed protein product [Dibothriocephalus latus]